MKQIQKQAIEAMLLHDMSLLDIAIALKISKRSISRSINGNKDSLQIYKDYKERNKQQSNFKLSNIQILIH